MDHRLDPDLMPAASGFNRFIEGSDLQIVAGDFFLLKTMQLP